MSERSLKAFDYYQDLAQRAEYLTLGVLSASIAFFWQSHEPDVLDSNPSTMHLLGLLLLFCAFGFSFRGIHWKPLVFGAQSHELDYAAERADLVTSLSNGKSVISGSKGVMDLKDQMSRIQELDQLREKYNKEIQRLHDKWATSQKFRNLFMFMGYFVMLCQRIWIPYY